MEAREVLQHRVPGSTPKPGLTITDAGAEVVAATEAGVVVALRWRYNASNDLHHQYQVLKMRDGLIVDMQDFADERAALKSLGSSDNAR